MLGQDFSGQHIVGWMASEKLDGIRCIWDGERLFTRNFRPIHAPVWFVDSLPKIPLDGELYVGIDTLSEMAGIARRKHPRDEDWLRVRFHVFDAPDERTGYSERMATIRNAVAGIGHCVVVESVKIKSENHMLAMLESVLAKGGEGLMIREPHAEYRDGRTDTLLKVKLCAVKR